jgi:hypothetical protein
MLLFRQLCNLYVKEVEFIPLANMCPKPIVGNFFGYSLAERLVPMQEYATSPLPVLRWHLPCSRQLQELVLTLSLWMPKKSSVACLPCLFLDRKFDPAKHVYEFDAMQGNLAYVQSAMQRFDADKMAMIGMTSPNDVLNPEVMKDGNSGYKLQLAMGPNQLIQDEMVKNCAIGLRDMIYIGLENPCPVF